MHVAIFADIEGSFGIWRMRQCRTGTSEWQYGRECLTEDVNHVIQGAFEGGATKVTVKDTHDTGFNCLTQKLDSRANYVGGHFVRPTLFGESKDYDLILYVAIHAGAGTPNAFFPHTHYGIFSDFKINDHRVCEMDIYAAALGELGLPVGFFSGEDIAVQQAQNCLPWAKSIVVDKRKEAYTSGEKSLRYLAEGRDNLRKTASEAVHNIDSMKLLVVRGPLHFETEFRNEKLAKKFNTWNFRQTGARVEWDAQNMTEGFEKLNKLTFFPKRIYPFRGLITMMMRKYFGIKNRYFAPQPNPEDAALLPFDVDKDKALEENGI